MKDSVYTVSLKNAAFNWCLIVPGCIYIATRSLPDVEDPFGIVLLFLFSLVISLLPAVVVSLLTLQWLNKLQLSFRTYCGWMNLLQAVTFGGFFFMAVGISFGTVSADAMTVTLLIVLWQGLVWNVFFLLNRRKLAKTSGN